MTIPRSVPKHPTAVTDEAAGAVIDRSSGPAPRAGRVFGAEAYGAGIPGYSLADIPLRWWRKIILDYGGRQTVLVYLAEPADPSELPELMWKLQCAAGRYGFRVTVITSDGRHTDAPRVRLGRSRRGRAR